MKSIGAPQTRLLARLMSDLSQDYFCAGWLMGCEYSLWADLTGSTVMDHEPWGITAEEKEELRFLHEQAGGWIIWSEDEKDRTFVTTQKWLSQIAQ